jgi:methylglyoxal synthase
MRLSDQWHVKRLMNSGSVTEWFRQEADMDKDRNLRATPLQLMLPGTQGKFSPERRRDGGYGIFRPSSKEGPKKVEDMTIALIAHDDMKTRMIEFALDYETELGRFARILATGTTGRDIGDAASSLQEANKIYRYHSGPKGGDIEIATEVLFGRCHVVVFFIDPLHPHPHIEDIRVVFGACMIQDQVRMLTNEMQGREWMEQVVKRGM